MQGLIAWYHQANSGGGWHIPALDGLLPAMVLVIGAYHIWQAELADPCIPWFAAASPGPAAESGLSVGRRHAAAQRVLLYLPHARAKENNRLSPPVLPFYRRRFARIMPTYVLNLAVVFLVVALPGRLYATPWHATRDILAHLTFTHNLFPFSYLHTPLNGVLWTLAVEVQFYVLFPLLAGAFRRMPLMTYLGMAGWRSVPLVGGAIDVDAGQPAARVFRCTPWFCGIVYASLQKRMKEDA